MADAAISFAVQKLGDALINKVTFLKGVEDKVRWLKDELKFMQCFLKDAAEKQGQHESVCQWISDVREVAQDAEDAIDIFTIKIQKPKRMRDLVRKWGGFPTHLSHLNRVGNEIESIRSRLDEIAKRRDRYGIKKLGEESSSSRSRSDMVQLQSRMEVLFQKDKAVVRLKDDADVLLNKVILNNKKRGLSLALIEGIGGIGKSTLARKIYNHPNIAARFKQRAWVVVSSEFAADDIMKQIMYELSVPLSADELKNVESIQDRVNRQIMLQKMLRKRLEGTRFFIVLDDVWEDAHWQVLKYAFPDEQGHASRLLFTSRKEIFAKHDAYIHKMKVLNSGQSWELLSKTAFIGTREGIRCPEELEDIGRKILEKCHGLPLAITVTGGLLVNEGESEEGWEKVLRRIKAYGSKSNKIEEDVSAVLELSYHNLPSHLKPCFLSLAFFKEDEVIQAKRLVHIWVALGLVQVHKSEEDTVEEIAKRYLDELINRNLVQVKKMTTGGRVKQCNVHDLLRELSIKKAKEEIGFENLIIEKEGNSSSSSISIPRHLVVRSSDESLIEIGTLNENKNKHVRSLFLHIQFPCRIILSSWKGFELLRILDIDADLFWMLPSSIRASIGIRYLRVRSIDLIELPSWLDDFKNLEVLDIVSLLFVEFPDVTWKMNNLRHLYTKIYSPTLPNIMKKSSWNNLETLKYMSADSEGFVAIQQTCPRLRKLGIDFGSKVEETKISLEKILLDSEVQVLHLKWHVKIKDGTLIIPNSVEHVTKLKLKGPMGRFPGADMFPQNITHLTISKIGLKIDECIQELSKLPSLLLLKLGCCTTSRSMKVRREGFCRLKVFRLKRVENLRNIEIEEGGMPQLQRLELYGCRTPDNIDDLRERNRQTEIIIIAYSLKGGSTCDEFC